MGKAMLPEGSADLSNPFLQFVDPMLYRSLVDDALRRSETGRRIRLLAISQPNEPQPSGRLARCVAAFPAQQPSCRDKDRR
jgi:hypothetical protein